MKNKNVVLYFVAILFCFSAKAQQITILQETFSNYSGTAATLPIGWLSTKNGNYTSSGYSGASGPNSYKFSITSSLTTPQFSNADSVQFWLKRGSASDATSSLLISESVDNTAWNTITNISPIPTTASTLRFPVDTASHYLKFTYTKGTGNLAFDDFLLKGAAPEISTSVAENQSEKNNFLVFPNPAKDQLNIQLNTLSKNYFFEVYNNVGQKILSGNFSESAQNINVGNLKKGLYLLVLSDHKTRYAQKFIKE